MNKSELEELFKNYDNKTTPHFSLNGQKLWGRVVNVYDGDTLTIVLSVFNGIYKFSVRMNGIDTCEVKSKNDKNKELACFIVMTIQKKVFHQFY